MLSGFNTNIRHRSVLFHVQSEDSGRDHPHIITHLYYGGTILASEKSSYADHLDDADLTALVKQRMESQHKAVLKRLTGGEFDATLRERLGPAVFGGADTGTSTRPDLDQTSPPETSGEAPAAGLAPEPAEAADGGSFGSGIVSEKQLDEVILDYLVDSARKRKRKRK
jgi:hypothetical protein